MSTTTMNATECLDIATCSPSGRSSRSHLPMPSTTDSYFTTMLEDESRCNYLNSNGFDIPTAKCLTISATESQRYECSADNVAIEWTYFGGSSRCDGASTFSLQYPMEALLDWNCSAPRSCLDTEYMELVRYKSTGDCSEDAISETAYDSTLLVVDQCMKRRGGGGVVYQCTNNQNAEGVPGGYTVTTFFDEDCLQQNESTDYDEIECVGQSERRQHLVFCRGENHVVLEREREEAVPIMECNYFVHSVDPLGVVGQPLNECMDIQHHDAVYSKRYQCNRDHTGIEEAIYKSAHCNEQDLELLVPRPEITDFYCDSPFECSAMATSDGGDGGMTSNAVMIGKQYTNDSCESPNESFWYFQHNLVDECWPLGNGLFAVMSCDDLGFVHYSLFNDAQCGAENKAFSQRFDEFDCIFGKLFEVISCPNWRAPTTTTTTTTTTSMAATNQNGSTQADTLEPLQSTEYIDTTLYITTGDGVQSTQSPSKSASAVGDPLKGEEEECVNMFGGGDVGGLDCQYLADIICAVIVMFAGIMACLVCWCWHTRDRSAHQKGGHRLSLSRSGSRLSVSNGNDNADLHAIQVKLEAGDPMPPGAQEAEDADCRYEADHEEEEEFYPSI